MSRLGHRPPSVDFIENHLPKYHPAFVNPPVHYDTMSGKYVPSSQELVPRPRYSALLAPEISATPPDDSGLPPRPYWTTTGAMKYWNDIFPGAMKDFRSTPEPKGRSKTTYNVRDKDDWDSICDTLEAARSRYRGEGGSVGWLRKMRRRAADNIAPVATTAKIVSKAVPSNPYSTPVLIVVEILLDVRQGERLATPACANRITIFRLSRLPQECATRF